MDESIKTTYLWLYTFTQEHSKHEPLYECGYAEEIAAIGIILRLFEEWYPAIKQRLDLEN